VIFEGNLPSVGGGAEFAGNPTPPDIYYYANSNGWSSLTTSEASNDFGPYSVLAPVPPSPSDGFDFTVASGDLTLTGCDPGCSGTRLAIPSSIGGYPVTAIGDGAFQSDVLTSVTLPDSVTSIGSYAFADNFLTSVTMPDLLTTIGTSAFQNNGISSVTIPASVSAVGMDAFAENGLSSVTFLGAPPSGLANAFLNNPGGPAYYYSIQSGWSTLSVNQGASR
jgi:hypothetical protein